MIDTNNLNQKLTPEMRRTILQRSIYTQPYFYRASVLLGATKEVLFESVTGVNRDFYLTEYQTNFTDIFDSIGNYNVTIYTGYDRSVYQYNNLRKLPSGVIFEDARNGAVTPFSGVDRQQEKYPFLVRGNDKIYIGLEVDSAPNPITAEFVLKGFNVLNEIQALSNRQIDQCNASLAKDVEWQIFKLEITEDVEQRSYIIENDNKPRILLGFGAVNRAENIPNVEIGIIDLSRRLRLTDSPIPLEFIAPRVPIVEDTHIYYLPVEYYLEPYAKIQFDVNYIKDEVFSPVEVDMLTRTV